VVLAAVNERMSYRIARGTLATDHAAGRNACNHGPITVLAALFGAQTLHEQDAIMRL
jgi:hypothetical protein